jgi:hypothetical protein
MRSFSRKLHGDHISDMYQQKLVLFHSHICIRGGGSTLRTEREGREVAENETREAMDLVVFLREKTELSLVSLEDSVRSVS